MFVGSVQRFVLAINQPINRFSFLLLCSSFLRCGGAKRHAKIPKDNLAHSSTMYKPHVPLSLHYPGPMQRYSCGPFAEPSHPLASHAHVLCISSHPEKFCAHLIVVFLTFLHLFACVMWGSSSRHALPLSWFSLLGSVFFGSQAHDTA